VKTAKNYIIYILKDLLWGIIFIAIIIAYLILFFLLSNNFYTIIRPFYQILSIIFSFLTLSLPLLLPLLFYLVNLKKYSFLQALSSFIRRLQLYFNLAIFQLLIGFNNDYPQLKGLYFVTLVISIAFSIFLYKYTYKLDKKGLTKNERITLIVLCLATPLIIVCALFSNLIADIFGIKRPPDLELPGVNKLF
jgi:hypothetical protein